MKSKSFSFLHLFIFFRLQEFSTNSFACACVLYRIENRSDANLFLGNAYTSFGFCRLWMILLKKIVHHRKP